MPNRRRFLQAAAALSAAPAMAGTASAAAGPGIELVVYDDRYEASRAFGQAALSLGARVRRISGDITGLWNSELYALWRDRPAAIAGMTTRSSLFCLEQIGWDSRMRLAHRVSHLDEAALGWAERTAQDLLHRPHAGAPAPEMLTMATSDADEHTLYSWIIAPSTSRARTRTV